MAFEAERYRESRKIPLNLNKVQLKAHGRTHGHKGKGTRANGRRHTGIFKLLILWSQTSSTKYNRVHETPWYERRKDD
jgi:hypothetical protein